MNNINNLQTNLIQDLVNFERANTHDTLSDKDLALIETIYTDIYNVLYEIDSARDTDK